MKPIYLDNAATSWPKPAGVIEALSAYYTEVGATAGRGEYGRALASARILYDARNKLAMLFNTAHSERFIFTLNATMALNMAIKGILQPGDRVVTSVMEHNSVVRPLEGLKERIGINVEYIPASSEGLIDPDDFARSLREKPAKLVVLVHSSNVCGTIQPIDAVGRIAHENGAVFLVDAAQSAGAVPIDLEKTPIDILAFPGHKGLLGPLGTGALYIDPCIELIPLIEGGTGSNSALIKQPEYLPDHYEAGSHNAAGIAGLIVALDYLQERTVKSILCHESELAHTIKERLVAIDGLTVYGPKNSELHTGVVSFTIAGYDPSEVGMMLENRFGIMVRTGLHCAPLAHKALGTYQSGSVRASVGPFTTIEEIDALTLNVAEIVEAR